MLDRRDRLGLGLEPGEILRARSGAGADHLEGDEPVEPDLPRLVDDPHPPSPSTPRISYPATRGCFNPGTSAPGGSVRSESSIGIEGERERVAPRSPPRRAYRRSRRRRRARLGVGLGSDRAERRGLACCRARVRRSRGAGGRGRRRGRARTRTVSASGALRRCAAAFSAESPESGSVGGSSAARSPRCGSGWVFFIGSGLPRAVVASGAEQVVLEHPGERGPAEALLDAGLRPVSVEVVDRARRRAERLRSRTRVAHATARQRGGSAASPAGRRGRARARRGRDAVGCRQAAGSGSRRTSARAPGKRPGRPARATALRGRGGSSRPRRPLASWSRHSSSYASMTAARRNAPMPGAGRPRPSAAGAPGRHEPRRARRPSRACRRSSPG